MRARSDKRGLLIILIIMVLVIFDLSGGLTSCTRKIRTFIYPLDYQEIVERHAKENDLEPALVMAMIKVESNYVVDAHSGKASGLMQLTDGTARWIAEKINIDIGAIDLMDPEDNIQLGCYYIRHLINNYDGNIDVALAAYNGGPGNVSRWLRDKKYSKDGKTLDYIPFKETREYVKKVHKQKTRYEKILEEQTPKNMLNK